MNEYKGIDYNEVPMPPEPGELAEQQKQAGESKKKTKFESLLDHLRRRREIWGDGNPPEDFIMRYGKRMYEQALRQLEEEEHANDQHKQGDDLVQKAEQQDLFSDNQ